MGHKVKFARTPPPKPLKFWQPHKGKAMTHWLPDDEFDAAARKHGIPVTKDGFALWGWWRKPTIYLRARCLNLFAHEVQHIETRSNFHE